MSKKLFLTDEELDRNYDAFKAALPGLMKNHAGCFALVRGGVVGEVYETRLAAHQVGWRLWR